jgi:type IV pilus assembly protein PilA
LALESLKSATKAKDIDRLREVVDFNSVKANLKDDLKAHLLTSAKEGLQDNPFAALGVLLVNAMVDPMVDAMVSPAGLAALVGEGRIEGLKAEENANRDVAAASNVEVEQGYVTYSLYRVRISREKNSLDVLTLTLRREGFATWRLSRIGLPETAFAFLGTANVASVVDADYSIRAKVAEVILAMSVCRTSITERYAAYATSPPTANVWGCESTGRGSKYVRSIATDVDGTILATVQGINPRIDGSAITLIPFVAPGSRAVASRDLGKGLYGWLCGGAGTTLGKPYLPASCRGQY